MEYDIPRNLSPEGTSCIDCLILLWKKQRKHSTDNLHGISNPAEWEKKKKTNILPAELAESVLEVSLLLAQMGSSSEFSLFTYGVSKTPAIRHML